jgi:hypothetical protein
LLKRHPRESGDPICVQASGSLKSRRNAPKLDPRLREDDVIYANDFDSRVREDDDYSYGVLIRSTAS